MVSSFMRQQRLFYDIMSAEYASDICMYSTKRLLLHIGVFNDELQRKLPEIMYPRSSELLVPRY